MGITSDIDDAITDVMTPIYFPFSSFMYTQEEKGLLNSCAYCVLHSIYRESRKEINALYRC